MADCRQLTSIQPESDVALCKSESATESCNFETANGDHAMQLQCGEWQASLKPALGQFCCNIDSHNPFLPYDVWDMA